MGKKSASKAREHTGAKPRKNSVVKAADTEFKKWFKDNGWNFKNGILYQWKQNNSNSHTMSELKRMFLISKNTGEDQFSNLGKLKKKKA